MSAGLTGIVHDVISSRTVGNTLTVQHEGIHSTVYAFIASTTETTAAGRVAASTGTV